MTTGDDLAVLIKLKKLPPPLLPDHPQQTNKPTLTLTQLTRTLLTQTLNLLLPYRVRLPSDPNPNPRNANPSPIRYWLTYSVVMAIFMQKQFKDNVEISLTLHTYTSQQMQMDLENNSHSAVIMLISKHHFPLFI